MPIELDWNISPAPGDTPPVPPASPPPSEGKGQEPGRPAAIRRWRFALLVLLVLGLAASLAVTAVSRRGWAEVRGQVVALVKLEEELARAGDVEALLAIQDPVDARWRIVRAQLAQDGLPAWVMLVDNTPAGEQLVIQNLEALSRDIVVADVERTYIGPDGRPVRFHGPQFYRRSGESGWVRIAPPGSFWQEPDTWEGPHLHILYHAPDAEVVAELGAALSQRLMHDCIRLELPCVSPVYIWFSSDPVYSLPTSWEARHVYLQVGNFQSGRIGLHQNEMFLALPSPQFGQLPVDEAAKAALLDNLTFQASRLLAEKLYGNTPQAQEVLRQMLFSDAAAQPPADGISAQVAPVLSHISLDLIRLIPPPSA